jgi:hypothetical protein
MRREKIKYNLVFFALLPNREASSPNIAFMTSGGHPLSEYMGVTTESFWAFSKEYPSMRSID